MQTKILKKYAEIKAQIKELEEQRKVIEESVINEVKDSIAEVDGRYRAETDYGTFTVFTKATSWRYTPRILKIEEKLKIAKYTEQQKGLAKPIIKEVLTYTSNEKN